MSTLETVGPDLAGALEIAAIEHGEDSDRPVERGRPVHARLKSLDSDGFATMRAAVVMGRAPSDPSHVQGCTRIRTLRVKACLENASSGYPALTNDEWESRCRMIYEQMAALVSHPSSK